MALPKEQRVAFPIRGKKLLQQVRIFPLEIRLFESDTNQAAVSVSKQVEKLANKRNLIRRQCFSRIQQAFKEKHLGIVLVRVYSKTGIQDSMTEVVDKCIALLRC